LMSRWMSRAAPAFAGMLCSAARKRSLSVPTPSLEPSAS
jgi:hypothetical protein